MLGACSQCFGKDIIDRSTFNPQPTFNKISCIFQQIHLIQNVIFMHWSQDWYLMTLRSFLAESKILKWYYHSISVFAKYRLPPLCSALGSTFSRDQSQPCEIFGTTSLHWIAMFMGIFGSINLMRVSGFIVLFLHILQIPRHTSDHIRVSEQTLNDAKCE